MNAIGVHVSGTHIRVCGIDATGSPLHVEDRIEENTSSDLWDLGAAEMVSILCQQLPDRTLPVHLAVPGGIYQIRRVPLEVAEDVDRKSQVDWEVGQALSDEAGKYAVDYVAHGSAATWIAIPAALLSAVHQAFEDEGVEASGVCAEPVGLAHALRRQHRQGRSRAILATLGWVSTVELQDGAMISASSQSTFTDPASGLDQMTMEQLMHKKISETSLPTYLAGDGAYLEPYLGDSIALHPLQNESFPDDTMLSIAYGTALSAIHEDPL